jgi:hypothetical protein
MSVMDPESRFPEKGILWRGWSDATRSAIADRKWPVLLFVNDSDPFIWPFLREIFKAMPANARLRALLHEFFTALYVEKDALPAHLSELGAGGDYHIAILSPYGLTPMVTFDPVSGKPAQLVDQVVVALERLVETWRA